MSPPLTPPPPGTVRCPRCGSAVGPEQDWCLVCGAAARTRLAATPNWRAPIVALAGVVVVAILALVIAFAVLTDTDDAVVPGVTPTETQASTPPPGAVGGAATTTPAVTGITGATGVPGVADAPGITGATGSSGTAADALGASTGSSGAATRADPTPTPSTRTTKTGADAADGRDAPTVTTP